MANIETDERAKYEAAWTGDAYRVQSDGEPVAGLAWFTMGCKPGESLIDWGCGAGRGGKLFKQWGMNVTGFDIAANCLDPDVDIPLVLGTLWEPPATLQSDYAFCTDVLEHVPADRVHQCIAVIAQRTRKAAFLQVDTVVDQFGDAMEPPQRLHLSVYWPECWLGMIKDHWPHVTDFAGSYSRWTFLCRK